MIQIALLHMASVSDKGLPVETSNKAHQLSVKKSYKDRIITELFMHCMQRDDFGRIFQFFGGVYINS